MRPLCRYCGKPLPKRTSHFYCFTEPPKHLGSQKDWVVGVFRSRGDLQKVTNLQVTSISRHPYNQHWLERDLAGTISDFTVWDGESYRSAYGQGFFCTLRCAADFAGVYARLGKVTTAYQAAYERQIKKRLMEEPAQ